MSIVDEDIAKVRAASDIVDVISQYTQLRKVGRRWSGLCPFHTEKTPSFSVNQEEGLYYCFGCGVRGDVITFVREMEKLDFAAAVEWLAAKVGIALNYTERNESASRQRINELHALVGRAVEFYHDRLLSGADAGPARAYLRSRGFDRVLIERFSVGWAPDEWDHLARHLRTTPEMLGDSGLGFVNRVGRQQDFFRSRIVFPIFDVSGKPVGFGGRKLPNAEGPKYQNSRENALYAKSSLLYGLNWAKADVVSGGQVIVCEGYTDVIGFARAGMNQAVATCGTALTESHIRLLKRFTNRIVLAYDADEAGRSAAERVYEWERAHDVEIHVLELPAGTDPDELGRRDPEALKDAVDQARPFLGFRLRRLLERSNLATPEGRVRAARAALDLIAEHPSTMVRDQYVVEVAGACRMDPHELRSVVARADRAPGEGGREESFEDASPHRQPTRRRPQAGSPELEREAVRMLINDPENMAPQLFDVLFEDSEMREMALAIVGAGSVSAAAAMLGPDREELLYRTAMEPTTGDGDEVVARLVERCALRCINALTREARSSDDPLEFAPIIGWLKLQVEQIRDDETSMESSSELIAWLKEHAAEFS